jgi:caa(3)-type oxidase subunit IV
MGLMAFSVAASFLPGGRTFVVVVIFAAAFIKAILVAANFMHLRFEPPLIYAFVLIPILFLVVLAAALLPDFVWHSAAR